MGEAEKVVEKAIDNLNTNIEDLPKEKVAKALVSVDVILKSLNDIKYLLHDDTLKKEEIESLLKFRNKIIKQLDSY